MIYIDITGHLIADSEAELHTFAQNIGLKRKWYQDKRLPHYDCTTEHMRQKAIKFGAKLVSSREIIKILKVKGE